MKECSKETPKKIKKIESPTKENEKKIDKIAPRPSNEKEEETEMKKHEDIVYRDQDNKKNAIACKMVLMGLSDSGKTQVYNAWAEEPYNPTHTVTNELKMHERTYKVDAFENPIHAQLVDMFPIDHSSISDQNIKTFSYVQEKQHYKMNNDLFKIFKLRGVGLLTEKPISGIIFVADSSEISEASIESLKSLAIKKWID